MVNDEHLPVVYEFDTPEVMCEPDDGPRLTPEVDDMYWQLHNYVEMVSRGTSNALLIEAAHGIGKSYQIERTLDGTVGTDNYRTISGYITPVELYHTLYEGRDSVIFCDDLEGIVANKKCLSLLKQCLWSTDDTRRVEWRSTSGKIDVPEQFQFRGRMILVFNEIPDNKTVQSLKDRVLSYRMSFDYSERIRLIKEIARAPYEGVPFETRREVAEWIADNTMPGAKPSLRTLFHCLDCRRHEDERWRELAAEFVQADEELLSVRRLLRENDTVDDAASAYSEETGKSKRTFYRVKKRIDDAESSGSGE